jgi:hypothetical protein
MPSWLPYLLSNKHELLTKPASYNASFAPTISRTLFPLVAISAQQPCFQPCLACDLSVSHSEAAVSARKLAIVTPLPTLAQPVCFSPSLCPAVLCPVCCSHDTMQDASKAELLKPITIGYMPWTYSFSYLPGSLAHQLHPVSKLVPHTCSV